MLSQKGCGVTYQSKAQDFLPSSLINCSVTNVEEERAVFQQQNRKDFSKVEFQESHKIVIKKFSSSVLSNKNWSSTEIKANGRSHSFCLFVFLCHKSAQGCLWLCLSLKLSFALKHLDLPKQKFIWSSWKSSVSEQSRVFTGDGDCLLQSC